MKTGLLLVRLVIGGLFVGHGTQKLFGWFGGPGPDGTEQMMRGIGMQPARRHGLAAGLTETTSGAMLAAGLATPLAASGIIGVMLTAIRKVHLKNGIWNANGGYEYNLMVIAALLSLVDGGPGEWSADRALGIDDAGLGWALAALATGAAASTAAIEYGRRRTAAAEAERERLAGEGHPKEPGHAPETTAPGPIR